MQPLHTEFPYKWGNFFLSVYLHILFWPSLLLHALQNYRKSSLDTTGFLFVLNSEYSLELLHSLSIQILLLDVATLLHLLDGLTLSSYLHSLSRKILMALLPIAADGDTLPL